MVDIVNEHGFKDTAVEQIFYPEDELEKPPTCL